MVLDADMEPEQLKHDVMEILRLKLQLSNVHAFLKVNTQLLETLGDWTRVLATSFFEPRGRDPRRLQARLNGTLNERPRR